MQILHFDVNPRIDKLETDLIPLISNSIIIIINILLLLRCIIVSFIYFLMHLFCNLQITKTQKKLKKTLFYD